MKLVNSLTTVAFFSLSSIFPCFVLGQPTSALSGESSAIQIKYQDHLEEQVKSEPIRVAGIFRDILRVADDALDLAEQERQRREEREARERREQERLAREEEARRRQEEYEEARRVAAEEERLEAVRRREYFESLSPEQQEVFLAEQEARQSEADTAAMLFLLQMFAIGSAIDDSTTTTNRDANTVSGCEHHEILTAAGNCAPNPAFR